jgi:hypothetical protein
MKGSIYNRLHIPVPCHEDWNKMTPDQKGAFCKSCNKSVYDFTAKTEQEVESILIAAKSNEKEVCGRFNNDQLAKLPDLVIPLNTIPQDLSPFKRFAIAAFIIFGTTLFGCVNAYGQKMGKVRLSTKEIATPVVEKETVSIKGEVAYIPEKDTVVPVKCQAPANDNFHLTGDTVIMPENPDAYGGISFVEGPDTIIDALPLTGQVIVNDGEMIDSIDDVEELPEISWISEMSTITGAISMTEVVSLPTLGWTVIMPDTEEIKGPAVIDITDAPVIAPAEPAEMIASRNEALIDTTSAPSEEDKLIDDSNKNALLSGDGGMPSLRCWPNPSTGPVTINYEVKKRCDIRMEIYDSYGKKVLTLIEAKNYYNGIYNTTFDLSSLDAGTYVCRLQSGSEVNTTRVVITK